MTNQNERLTGKNFHFSIQHFSSMFGATVLLTFIKDINRLTLLQSVNIGTLLFYLLIKGKVPVFLGTLFALSGACSQ